MISIIINFLLGVLIGVITQLLISYKKKKKTRYTLTEEEKNNIYKSIFTRKIPHMPECPFFKKLEEMKK